MSPAENQPLDIEKLMARIRAEVRARKQQAAPPSPKSRPLYVTGHVLKFAVNGNADPYQDAGWSQSEPEFCWTQEEAADLIFQFEKPPGDLVLSFTVNPHLGGDVDYQKVTAMWDNIPVGSWTIRQAGTYHALILSQAVEQIPIHRLRFLVPGSFSPASKGLSTDGRRLGLAFRELVLQPAHASGFHK